jgi:hypothetical protein
MTAHSRDDDDDKKKPASSNTTSEKGSRPGSGSKAPKEDLMGQPPGPSPAPNPESAPGGDKVE